MTDATPNSSKLAQILLQLKEVNGSDESTLIGENLSFLPGSSMVWKNICRLLSCLLFLCHRSTMKSMNATAQKPAILQRFAIVESPSV